MTITTPKNWILGHTWAPNLAAHISWPGWVRVDQQPLVSRFYEHPILDSSVEEDVWDTEPLSYFVQGGELDGNKDVFHRKLSGQLMCLSKEDLEKINPQGVPYLSYPFGTGTVTGSGIAHEPYDIRGEYSFTWELSVMPYEGGYMEVVKHFASGNHPSSVYAEYFELPSGFSTDITYPQSWPYLGRTPVVTSHSWEITGNALYTDNADRESIESSIEDTMHQAYYSAITNWESQGSPTKRDLFLFDYRNISNYAISGGQYQWRKPLRVLWDYVFSSWTEHYIPWSDMAADAYGSMPYQNNGIAYFKDTFGMMELLKGTADNVLGLVRGRRLKAAASLFLSFHYGWKLQFMDTEEYLSGLKSANKPSRLSATQVVSSEYQKTQGTYMVYYEPFAECITLLGKFWSYLDLSIDFSNIWDLTPWSFVVDWFVNVGDVLQTIDNYNSLYQKHKVTCVGRSTKTTRKLTPSQVGVILHQDSILVGDIVATQYHRWYNTNLTPPSTNLSSSNSLTSIAHNHWVEGSSLFITKM